MYFCTSVYKNQKAIEMKLGSLLLIFCHSLHSVLLSKKKMPAGMKKKYAHSVLMSKKIIASAHKNTSSKILRLSA